MKGEQISASFLLSHLLLRREYFFKSQLDIITLKKYIKIKNAQENGEGTSL